MAEDGLRDGAEILMDEPVSARGRRMLEALAECSSTVVTRRYEGRHRILVLYGIGRPERLAAKAVHASRGGHVAMWDLGYWDRDEAMRLSVDSIHPTARQIAMAPDGCRRDLQLRNEACDSGPILLAGLGKKSARMLGFGPREWENKKARELRKRFPNRQIVWRVKGPNVISIDDALAGCSLVVCRHSNVGVDACIAGIPVECEDGAAFALYANGSNPTEAERREFLRRLGWWNWFPSEAQQALNWIERVTECG